MCSMQIQKNVSNGIYSSFCKKDEEADGSEESNPCPICGPAPRAGLWFPYWSPGALSTSAFCVVAGILTKAQATCLTWLAWIGSPSLHGVVAAAAGGRRLAHVLNRLHAAHHVHQISQVACPTD